MTSVHFSITKTLSTLMLVVLLSLTTMSSSFAAANPTFTSALWVAEDNGVLKVTASDGNVLFEIANIGRVDAVATDGERGRLWVATQAAIHVYNFAGEVILSKPSPFTVNTQEADDIMMVINEVEGSVWLTNEVELIKLDSSATVVVQQSYADEVETLSFDSVNNRVWLAHDDAVSSIDATTGALISSFSNPQTGELDVDMIHYDKHLNELWLMEEHTLTRYDINGVKTFTSTITPLEEFTLDGKGNIWASDDNNLYYISSSDSVLFQVIPFPGDINEIEHLVVNPSDDSVWVANYYNIVNYSTQGVEQHRLNVLNKINGLAIYSDIYAPTISLVSPETNSITNNAIPTFLFNLQDKGVGADPTTIELVSNNLVIPTTCLLDAVTNNAVCTVNQALTDGVWDFTVTVKDYLGNQSASIIFSLSVDTVAPAITVNSHWNGAYVNQSAQAISGLLSEFSELYINGLPITLGLNNSFNYPVLLIEGQNNFLITAKDQAGNISSFPFVLFFDSVAPTAANVGSIVVSDVINGQSTVTGQAGSVEAGATVEITNLTTNVVTTVQANADGNFSLTISASPADQLNIVIIDKANNRSAISAMQVPLPLAIEIILPADGEIIQGDSVNIEGVFKGPDNTGIIINGEVVAINNDQFFVNNINLQPGVNTLTAYLTTPDGKTTQHAISITRNGTSSYSVDAEPYSGIYPLTVDFTINETQLNSIQSINVDFESDGIVDYTSNDLSLPVQFTYTLPGEYTATTTIIDINGVSYSFNNYIIVETPAMVDKKLQGIYNGMLNQLLIGNIDQSMHYLTGLMQDKFKSAFINAGDKLKDVIAGLGVINGGRLISNNIAEYIIVRTENGQQVAFAIYFIKGDDGVWRIGEM